MRRQCRRCTQQPLQPINHKAAGPRTVPLTRPSYCPLLRPVCARQVGQVCVTPQAGPAGRACLPGTNGTDEKGCGAGAGGLSWWGGCGGLGPVLGWAGLGWATVERGCWMAAACVGPVAPMRRGAAGGWQVGAVRVAAKAGRRGAGGKGRDGAPVAGRDHSGIHIRFCRATPTSVIHICCTTPANLCGWLNAFKLNGSSCGCLHAASTPTTACGSAWHPSWPPPRS